MDVDDNGYLDIAINSGDVFTNTNGNFDGILFGTVEFFEASAEAVFFDNYIYGSDKIFSPTGVLCFESNGQPFGLPLIGIFYQPI